MSSLGVSRFGVLRRLLSRLLRRRRPVPAGSPMLGTDHCWVKGAREVRQSI